MPNGMYGGVRGGLISTYSILFFSSLKLRFNGEMQMNVVVGEGLGPPAIAINLNLLLRDVEGAVPYDHEIASNLSTVSKLAIV